MESDCRWLGIRLGCRETKIMIEQGIFLGFMVFKEEPVYLEIVSYNHVRKMLKNYINGESVWNQDRTDCYYGYEAKCHAWKYGIDRKTFHLQCRGIYQMLYHMKNKELAIEYQKIYWSRDDAMELELEILTKCYDILKSYG